MSQQDLFQVWNCMTVDLGRLKTQIQTTIIHRLLKYLHAKQLYQLFHCSTKLRNSFTNVTGHIDTREICKACTETSPILYKLIIRMMTKVNSAMTLKQTPMKMIYGQKTEHHLPCKRLNQILSNRKRKHSCPHRDRSTIFL